MKWLWCLLGTSVSLMLGGLFNVLFMLPAEGSQGLVQKIFFIHVPSAFAFYTCLITGSLFGVMYLIERKDGYDRLSQAFVYVALLFALGVMVTGPLWAKPIWGVYWTWDPRLTTMLLMTLILFGYCSTRSILERSPDRKHLAKVVSAIIAVVASLDIIPIHYSVKLWRGVHPTVINNPGGLPPSYRWALQVMIVAFITFSILLSLSYYRYLKNKEELTKLMQRTNHA